VLTQAIHDPLEHLDRSATGVNRSGSEPGSQWHLSLTIEDHHGKIRVLLVAPVPKRELLLAMYGTLFSRANEDIYEEVDQLDDAGHLCLPHVE